jgi:transcriptional regulator with XRE-family HTH domain
MLILNDKFLRARLLEKGITTKQLAEKLNISQQGLNKRILNSKLYITDVFEIIKILNLPFEEIFKEVSE